MTKWHNGPNGPGICRAKAGNCPFGGIDSHFETKAEAQEAFDVINSGEFGMLPGVKVNTRKTANVYNSHGVSLSGSDLIQSGGYNEKQEYFRNLFNDVEMDGQAVVQKLNQDNNIRGAWKLKESSDDLIVVESKDAFGNPRFINIKLHTEVEEQRPADTSKLEKTMSAYDSQGTLLSSSNFISTNMDYNEEEEYIRNYFNDTPLDGKSMVDKLNNDKFVSGQWKVNKETDDVITLESADAFGNKILLDVKAKKKIKVDRRGQVSAKTSRGISTSLANYVSSGSGGTEENKEYFKNIVSMSDNDSDVLIDNLNNDERIFGEWSLENENNEVIELKNVDAFGNSDFITIYKT